MSADSTMMISPDTALANIRAEQVQRWRAGDRAPVEEFLNRHPNISRDTEAVLVLIYGEVLLREELDGTLPELSEFAQRFPSLTDALTAQFDFHRTLQSANGVAPPQIPGFHMVRELGRGGMGVVYLARDEKLNREVAVKVLLSGEFASEQARQRFRTEAEAVARLKHPNIVEVHAFGETDGRPYLVLEFVAGGSLDQRLQTAALEPRVAAETLARLADAIDHAHRNGILHRDLKPANILLSGVRSQESGVGDRGATLTPDSCLLTPKVSDFGLAKRLDASVGVTETSQLLGTPSYMAPEQCRGAKDVGPAADVYSLGVILYECLTGRPPFKAATAIETLAQVMDREPVSPRTLNPAVPRDLETVCLKCLSKEPAKRYGSAGELADDLRRYLEGRPVQACPPSAAYRFRKFARRNKAALLTASVVVAALVAGTAVATWQAVVATRAKRDALAAETETRIERDMAVAEKERASEEAAIANAINDFLQVDLLAEAAPEKNARNKQVTVEELLERAAARIAGKFEQRPTIEAAIRMTIGETYSALGNYAAAQPHAERALELRRRVLGEEHPRTVASLNLLARLYSSQGKFAMAEPLSVAALEISRRVLGPEHYETLVDMNNLAIVYRAQGEHSKAEPLFVETLEARRRSLGKEHRHTLASLNNLAALYWEQGRFARAEPLFVEVMEIHTRVLGEEHPSTLLCMMNLAGLYQEQGQFAKAEELKVKNLEVGRRVLGEEHPYMISFRNTLALLYQAQGRYTKAEQLFEEAVQISRRVLGEEHPDTLSSMNYLASLHQVQGRFADAGTFFIKTLEVRRRVLGNEHPDSLNSLNNLAALYQAQNQFSDAEPLLRESLNIRERKQPDDWKTFHTKSLLGGSLLGQGKYAEAEPLLLAGYEGMKQREAKIPWNRKPRLVETVESLVRLYEAWDKPEQAELWRGKLPTKTPHGAS